MRGILHRFHELGQPAAAEEDFFFAAVEDARKERFLEANYFQHAVLNRALGDEIHHPHWQLLAEPVDTANALLEHRRIPGQIHVDYHGGVLKVKPDAAGIRCQESPAAVIFAEAVHESLPLLSRYAAVEQDMVPVAALEAALQ